MRVRKNRTERNGNGKKLVFIRWSALLAISSDKVENTAYRTGWYTNTTIFYLNPVCVWENKNSKYQPYSNRP